MDGKANHTRSKVLGSGSRENPLGSGWFFFFLLIILPINFFSAGCQKKEDKKPAPPVVAPQRVDPGPSAPGETGRQGPVFRSILTRDLNRPVPLATFTRNDRIYLLTTWSGLQGAHEIKVLWVRPDGTVQETVRLNQNVSPGNPAVTTWAYLTFKKGLLNITPFEGKFIGAWKAQLFLDEKLLMEYPFNVS
jgi:hypothetical protein